MKTKLSILEPLRVGQIRKLRANKKGGTSRLVLIAEHDRRDGTYLVFLLNNMVEAAIPRDLCLSTKITSARYEIVLMTEYLARAHPEDFELESVHGSIDEKAIDRIRSLAHNNPFGKLPDVIVNQDMRIGGFPMQKYDSVWQFRSSEFDNFLKLTFVRDQAYVISSDYALRSLRQFEALRDPELVDEMPLDALFAMSRSREMVAA
jgi:hypothetical protein